MAGNLGAKENIPKNVDLFQDLDIPNLEFPHRDFININERGKNNLYYATITLKKSALQLK